MNGDASISRSSSCAMPALFSPHSPPAEPAPARGDRFAPVSLGEAPGDEIPVDEMLDERLRESPPLIAIVDIVGVLPHIQGQQRVPIIKQRRLAVRCAELIAEGGEVPEVALDPPSQRTLRFAALGDESSQSSFARTRSARAVSSRPRRRRQRSDRPAASAPGRTAGYIPPSGAFAANATDRSAAIPPLGAMTFQSVK